MACISTSLELFRSPLMGEVESKAYIVIDPSNSSTFLRESLQQHSSLSYVSLVGVGLLIVITHLYNRIFKNKP